MHIKDPVAFKRELRLHIIFRGFCYYWDTEGQADSPENWEQDQE